jgi:hypothetical protein
MNRCRSDDREDARELYCAIGRDILQVLARAREIDPVWVKVYIRLAGLWIVEDFRALHDEFMRVDALIRKGAPITAPAVHA